MPKLGSSRVAPSYRLHKQSGQAIVTIDGRDRLLGQYGSDASRAAYDRLIAQWLANGRRLPAAAPPELLVVDLVSRYWEHALRFYGRPDGAASSELARLRRLLASTAPLRAFYGPTPAAEFGPLALKLVRGELLKLGWCRSSVNAAVQRIVRMFRWAVSEQLLPPAVHQALAAVEGLRLGRCDARESEAVRPVPEAHVAAVRPCVSPIVRDMIDLQLLTGARPGEICAMRTCDVDTAGTLWLYRPPTHKTLHHGHGRTIYIGPKAQAILRPRLRPQLELAIFSPRESEAWHRAKRSARRRTPLTQGNRPNGELTQGPQLRRPGDQFTVSSYRRAIARGCEAAFAMPAELREPRSGTEAADTPDARSQRRQLRAAWRREHCWHPHQLRHNAATHLRREYGIETARVILGHRSPRMTEIYAELDHAKAQQVMQTIG
jgi:integrase